MPSTANVSVRPSPHFLAVVNPLIESAITAKKSDILIKPKEVEDEIKLIPEGYEPTKKASHELLREVGVQGEIEDRHRRRLIIDTDDLYFMRELGLYMSLTHQFGRDQTVMRAKDTVDEGPVLRRVERTAVVSGIITALDARGFKSERIKSAIEERPDARVQGYIDYHDHKGKTKNGIHVKVDHGIIRARFASVPDINLFQLEADGHHPQILLKFAEKVQASHGFEISTDAKEALLLENQQMQQKLALVAKPTSGFA